MPADLHHAFMEQPRASPQQGRGGPARARSAATTLTQQRARGGGADALSVDLDGETKVNYLNVQLIQILRVFVKLEIARAKLSINNIVSVQAVEGLE